MFFTVLEVSSVFALSIGQCTRTMELPLLIKLPFIQKIRQLHNLILAKRQTFSLLLLPLERSLQYPSIIKVPLIAISLAFEDTMSLHFVIYYHSGVFCFIFLVDSVRVVCVVVVQIAVVVGAVGEDIVSEACGFSLGERAEEDRAVGVVHFSVALGLAVLKSRLIFLHCSKDHYIPDWQIVYFGTQTGIYPEMALNYNP